MSIDFVKAGEKKVSHQVYSEKYLQIFTFAALYFVGRNLNDFRMLQIIAACNTKPDLLLFFAFLAFVSWVGIRRNSLRGISEGKCLFLTALLLFKGLYRK